MKAYILGIRDDPDQGNQIVFDTTARHARTQLSGDFIAENWIDITAHRCPQYDGMENLSKRELALAQWGDGWRWFDLYDVPDPDENTDEEFLAWYDKNFGHRND